MLWVALVSARPLWTDDPGLVEAGKMELEGGLDYLASEKAWGSYLQWKAGLGRLELDMGLGFDDQGAGPLELETKWGALDWLAIVGGWAVGESAYEAKLIAGREFFGKAELLANLVYSSETGKLLWGIAGGYSPTELLEVVAETYYEGQLTPGIGLRLNLGSLILDLYGSYPLEDKSPLLSGGFTFDW